MMILGYPDVINYIKLTYNAVVNIIIMTGRMIGQRQKFATLNYIPVNN